MEVRTLVLLKKNGGNTMQNVQAKTTNMRFQCKAGHCNNQTKKRIT